MPRPPSSEPKYPVQFRIGSEIFNLITNAAAEAGVSMNAWITQASVEELGGEESTPIAVTAKDLLNDKVTVTVRMSELLISTINEWCDDQDITRTVFLIDACLSKLSRQEDEERLAG